MTTTSAELDVIQHFFFGDPAAPLFGAYHAAAGPGQERRGVVLCAPWGQEYIRSHRALRQLALRLARRGIDVLRFDYSGCGDSAGDEAMADLDRWTSDVRTAVEELGRRSGARRFALVGLRLGGALAIRAADTCDNVDALALWEPVLQGVDYAAELVEQHRHALWRYAHRPGSPPHPGDPTEILGFALGPRLWGHWQALSLDGASLSATRSVLLVEHKATEPVSRFAQDLTARGHGVTLERIEGPVIWTEDPDKALVPQATLEAIVDWLAGGAS